jgi:Putative peptidoglycan binding domain
MTTRMFSILTVLALVAAMVAPALAQTSGGSTGTGSAPSTGSGSAPSAAPSATQPSTSTTQPSTSTTSPGTGSGTGTTGKAKSSPGTGQVGTGTSGAGSMPATGSTAGTSKSGMGMNGSGGTEQVKAMQKALQDKGMDPGPIDGIMGPKTMAALKAFQKDQKLTESGKLDDQTREKLGVSR